MIPSRAVCACVEGRRSEEECTGEVSEVEATPAEPEKLAQSGESPDKNTQAQLQEYMNSTAP